MQSRELWGCRVHSVQSFDLGLKEFYPFRDNFKNRLEYLQEIQISMELFHLIKKIEAFFLSRKSQGQE